MMLQGTRAPVLVVLGGLPATGKSTVATAVVRRTGFAFVRLDRIEQAIIASTDLEQPLGPVGYMIAYEVAGEQLAHGVSVVAESVNPLAITRNAWRDVATSRGAGLVEVELTCSDAATHRHRAQSRQVDVPGLKLPEWAQITGREYEPWDRDHLVIDTAIQTPDEAAAAIADAIGLAARHVLADRG
jgi:predicted kinase